MRFKDDSDAQDYRNITGPYSGEANLLLRQFAEMLDKVSRVTGHEEITITSYVRNDNIRSLHYYGRALDIRVFDKPESWYHAMADVGAAMALLNPRFRMNPHPELFRKEQQHIHIEIRD